MAGGFSVTQILHTAVKLGIPDQLASGPRSAGDLAAALGTDGRSLHRFLRIMVALGLLSEAHDGTFALAPLGAPLASSHPDSVRDRIEWIGEVSYPMAQAMLYAVQTGKPAFERVFGVPFFQYLAQRPDLGRIFNELMAEEVEQRAAAVVAAYDFGGAATIVDIGGGNGALLCAILRANPRARGIVFDIPGVVADAQQALQTSDVASRIELAGGDVFTDPLPQHADAYVLSHFIHDWSDSKAIDILRACRAAMNARGRLLVIEELLPERVSDAAATVGNDFNMLLLTGGTERTQDEYARLLGKAGLELAATTPFEAAPVHGGRRSNWAILECRIAERNA